MAERAEQELTDVAQRNQIDLCRYRVKKSVDGAYPAINLAQSIATYQELFTALYDFVKHGAKSAANYARDVRQNSLLNLAYTYPGSIGVLLSIDNTRDLFGSGELDEIIDALNRVVELESIDQVRSVAHEMGLNVVRNVFKWADQNWKSEYSVDIQWTRSDAVTKGGHVPRAQFLKLKSLIQETSDEEPEEIEVVGTLVGLHVLSDTFSISTENGDTYSGRLADGFAKRQYKIPGQYRSKIVRKTTVKYATEATAVTYSLLSLDEI